MPGLGSTPPCPSWLPAVPPFNRTLLSLVKCEPNGNACRAVLLRIDGTVTSMMSGSVHLGRICALSVSMAGHVHLRPLLIRNQGQG